MLSIGWGVRGRTYAKKTFYAEKNFHTQFADKTVFLLHSWVGFEVEIAYALILTEHNKTVIV